METLTKIEVARREIDAALKMYFNNGDPIIIYLCFMSGYKICRDLNKDGSSSISRDFFNLIIKYRGLSDHPVDKGIWKLMDAKYNALKHANNSDELVNLTDIKEETYLFLLFSVLEYQAVARGASACMELYLEAWERKGAGQTFDSVRQELSSDPDFRRRLENS